MTTRICNQTYHCERCGHMQTAETQYSRWYRHHPRLCSAEGNACTDQDVWCHRFMVDHDRSVQGLMLIETKVRRGKPTPSQDDTLGIVNQFLRNRKDTPTKKSRRQVPNAPVKVWSKFLHRWVKVRAFGVHLLVFSNLGPQDSKQMWWDGRLIDEKTLVKLHRFELDPDTLKPMDLRVHHNVAHPVLPFQN